MRETPMNFTGERMIPGNSPPSLEAYHRARYQAVIRRDGWEEGLRVLDCPCGTGYGSQMMCDAGAKLVVGVDVDNETVSFARAQYADPVFVSADMKHIVGKIIIEDRIFGTSPKAYFDLMVCIEGIEHVSEADGEIVIRQFAVVTKPGGRLFVTTPNRARRKSNNKFHLKEYTISELLALIETGGFWKVIHFCGQFRGGVADVVPFYPGQTPDYIVMEAKRTEKRI